MILSFRHKGLRYLFSEGNQRGVRPDHVRRLRFILVRLQASQSPADMNLPGLRRHAFKGSLKGHYAASVSGNWRVIFRFQGPEAVDVDYLDYH